LRPGCRIENDVSRYRNDTFWRDLPEHRRINSSKIMSNKIPQKLAEELGIRKPRREKKIVAPVELRGRPVKMMRLVLPYPPTDNHYYTIWMNRKVPSGAAKAYWKEVSIACTAQEAQHVIGRLTLEIWTHHEADYQYDIGNLIKATQDSLTKAGVYLDDKYIDLLIVHRGGIRKGNKHIIVHLEGEMPESVDLFARQD
jgi:Holliday junction resolvase RusA-like endonuclease